MNRLTLTREAFPEPGAMDVAVSHSVLRAVSEGSLDGTFRLHVPAPVVAFGRADRVTSGYRDAVRAARAHGFSAVERLAGGRAAVFHERTLAFSWVTADPEPRAGITGRFELTAGLMTSAFRSLGIDARIGELSGEYCPGSWSVNVGGRVKVMGVGQRLVRGAAHVGGVVVVDGGDRIREVLIPVYRALGLDWDPRTAGSLADRSPGLDTGVVADAIVESFSTRFDLVEAKLPARVVEQARSLVGAHLPEVA
ncbi:MAG: lipoate--protein ligase family protein [Actinobacteria bacterium]|nr:lipoate--protein ligase family protein [Actinomycetota bacterium]